MSFYTVAVGNPFDGVELHGLFADANEAGDWAAETPLSDDTWVVVEIHTPPVEIEQETIAQEAE